MNRQRIAYTIIFLSTALMIFGMGQSVAAQREVDVHLELVDSRTLEKVSFCSVSIEGAESTMGFTDDEGLFDTRLKTGNYLLKVSHISYQKSVIPLKLMADTSIVVLLIPATNQLKAVTVEGEAYFGEGKIENARMSTINLDRKQIQRIPNISGEQDILKVIQLQSGVSKGIEGSGDFFVRGGDADQNLLLLDGATVYNTGHLFGFVSVFNPDVIGDATFIKGAFPASYGGRLSSVLDIQTADEIHQTTEVSGSVGIIASRLTIKKSTNDGKVSFMLSGRRTYIDRILDALKTEVRVPYYFYDVNAKVVFRPNSKNTFYLSGYLGADVLDYQQPTRNDNGAFNANFDIDNNNQSFGWKYLFNEQIIGDLTLTRTDYNYGIFNSFFENRISTTSGISDLTAKYKLKKYQNKNINYSIGGEFQNHRISPIDIASEGIISNFLPSSRSDELQFSEWAFFTDFEMNLSLRWKMNLGYRHSFSSVGSKVYNNHEPRVAFRYKVTDHSSLKLGYSRMSQYMHRVSSSAVTLPVDLWYGVTDDIKPQTSNQYVLGYFHAWPKQKIIVETELYYKDMQNITEYEEGTNLILNTSFEESLLQGRGDAYGVELSGKREEEKWQLTLNYTLSWSNRYFSELNGGDPFPAKYDRRHKASVVGMYDIGKRWSFSLVWEFLSGSRFTPIIGQYSLLNPINSGIDLYYIYSDRNEVRLSDTHRMDVLLIFKSKDTQKLKSEWHLGVYNVYNRATPIAISIEDAGNNTFKYEQPGIFGTIPTISYHFKF